MSRTVRLAAFSSDPVACDAFHAFDPDSYMLISAINDSLVYIDCEGTLRPGLAVSWKRVDPLTVDFELRKGVRFHNGEPFDATSAAATINTHCDPEAKSTTGQGMFSPLVGAERISEHVVRIRWGMPDGMWLHRLHLFSAMYPAGVLAAEGPGAFTKHPIGTGAYRFESWERGRQIVLSRNEEHWAQRATVDKLVFPFIRKNRWIDALAAGEIDLAVNLDPHDAWRAEHTRGLVLNRRDAALSQWLLLRNRGPLADPRVRRALNHAVHRPLLCKIADHGWAEPLAGIQTPGEVGHNGDLEPYPYDPDLARALLKDAGYESGFTITGLVSETSATIYPIIREFVARIGVTMKAEIVPAGEWMSRVSLASMRGLPFDGDFWLSLMDNPLLHGVFHQFIFFFSHGPFTIMNDPDYDARFMNAVSEIESDKLDHNLQSLDRYLHDQAHALFTIREQAFAAAREGFDMPIAMSGHYNYDNFWNISVSQNATAGVPTRPDAEPKDPQLQRMLQATSYPGLLYLPAEERFDEPAMSAIWRNLELGETRWTIQSEEMVRSLIDQVDAETRLRNISRSTKTVGILALTRSGRVVFESDGYATVMGVAGSHPLSALLFDDNDEACWTAIRDVVDRKGSWSGVVNSLGPGGRRRALLLVTPALNEVNAPAGYMLVASDHAAEEERLRMKAEATTAALVQKALIPRITGTDVEVAEYYVPASETGGDWYCVHDGGSSVTLMLGDVTGHGTPAAFVTASVAGASKVLDLSGDPLPHIMHELNRVVCATGFGEYCMTFCALRINKETRRYEYTVAGHPSPLLALPNGRVSAVPAPRAGGELFGYRLEGSHWPQTEGELEPGTLILLYTDGITEGCDVGGNAYGFGRLRRFLQRANGETPCKQLLSDLVGNARRHYGAHPLDDDITLVMMRMPT